VLRILKDEHDLDEGHPAEIALGAKGFDEFIEGEVLVVEGAQDGVADAGERVADGGIAGEVRAEDKGVDEEADEAFGFDARAAGDGGPDDDIVGAGVALEEGLKRGKERHEEGDALAAAEGFEGVGEGAGEQSGELGAAVVEDGGAGAIGGELEGRGHAGEPVGPVGEVGAKRLAGELSTLPGGIVAVLDRERGQCRRAALAVSGIEFAELPREHTHRPAIGGDVVKGEEEHVVLGIQPDEKRAQHEILGEVKWPPGVGAQYAGQFLDALLRGRGAEVCDGQLHHGATIWTGSSSCTTNVVRSASWRSTMASSATRSVACSSLPRSRTANGTL
jgi:hypothetical protein